MSYSFEEFIVILKVLILKVSYHVQDTPASILMPYIFPNIYRKLNQNPIIFPLLIPIILLRLKLLRLLL